MATSDSKLSDSLNSDQDLYPPFFLELYEVSEASDIGLDFAHFAEALLTISGQFLPAKASDRQITQFYSNLHLKDLALAQACSRGSALAWERFLCRYREKLYAAALVITRNDWAARELSGSLSGDLFPNQEGAHESPYSKLASYSGRGSLEGWLKAVLAHAYVDRYRSERRIVSLDQRLTAIGNACLTQPAMQGSTAQFTTELRLAIEEACMERTAEQRFLLAAYFFDEWSLAEIAKRLGVHESTVSRRMDRILRELRASITRNLRKLGMSPRQIAESLQADVRDLPFEISGALLRGIDLARE